MRFSFLLLVCLFSLGLSAQEVIITGIIDGTRSGATPRAVELYVSGTVDLGDYRLDRYSNASTTVSDDSELTGVYTNEFVYVVKSDQFADFTATFGNTGDFANRIPGNIFGNGNDAFALVLDGTIVDQVGGAIGDATNIYENSWLYRKDNTGPDGGWTAENWNNVGNNGALNGLSFAAMGEAVPFGTFVTAPPGPSVSAATNGNLAEPDTEGGFIISLSEAATTDVTVTYTFTGTATEGSDFLDPEDGTVTIAAGQLSAEIDLEVVDDAIYELPESIELRLQSVSDPTYSLGRGATVTITDNEPVTALPISLLQGPGFASPAEGLTATIEGIVVGDFQGGNSVGLNGFFVQEEDADADDNPLTSEGIWIFDNSNAGAIPVAVGDKVQVVGQVLEEGDLTQLDATVFGGSITVISSDNPQPTPAVLDLPSSTAADLEAIEGMRTTFAGTVAVTSNRNLPTFGEFEVAAGERLIQFTECNAPDAAALAAFTAEQNTRRFRVDDGRGGTDNFPIRLIDGSTLSPTNSWRAGQLLTGLTGIMDERFGGYRLQGTGFASRTGEERPVTPPDVGGDVKVVGMNVLNYFTTLNSRGADTNEEFDRQEAKIVAAICALDADIVGLVEIENNGYGANGALQTLIDAISADCGTEYAFVRAPETGGDQIQVALIYKTATMAESGVAASLTSPASVFIGPGTNRVPLAQTFRVTDMDKASFGQEITVCVNHWKSKGGRGCGGGDDDTNGAGPCNGTRERAATAISSWLLNDDPTGTGETKQLIIGDLNAYTEERPITLLTEAGFVNTVRASAPAESFPCGSIPSYVFSGRWGSLDHAFASPAAAAHVTGAAPWTVNAPEPEALDYNTDDYDPALYAPDVFRFSDHDPVVVGLNLRDTATATVDHRYDATLAWVSGSEFRITGAPRGSQYLLTNTAGRIIDRRRIAGQEATIDGANLPVGLYFLVVRDRSSWGRTFKLLLNR